MNILITGALGHIGSELINKITRVKKLKNLYLIDSGRSNNINVLFNLKISIVSFFYSFKKRLNVHSLNQH